MSDNIYQGVERESYQGGLTVAGLLAGFAFTGAIESIAHAHERTPYTIMFASFLAAAFCFVMAVIGFWAILEWIATKKSAAYQEKLFSKLALGAFVVGLFAFAVGLGALGFMYSALAGLLSCVGTLITILYFLSTAVASARG